MGRVARRFPRVEPRRHARALVLGLLADLPRKNCWTIAEHAGQATPDGLQHLLAGAIWDHDKVRDDLRDWLLPAFATTAAAVEGLDAWRIDRAPDDVTSVLAEQASKEEMP